MLCYYSQSSRRWLGKNSVDEFGLVRLFLAVLCLTMVNRSISGMLDPQYISIDVDIEILGVWLVSPLVYSPFYLPLLFSDP